MTSYRTQLVIELPMVREASGPSIGQARMVAELCKDMENFPQECFVVWSLDQKNKVIDKHMIAIGSLTGCLVHPREVYRPALLDGAAAVFFIHNHPSGDPKPSADDIDLTARLVNGARLLGLRVLDHVVVGRGRFFSFVEEGLI